MTHDDESGAPGHIPSFAPKTTRRRNSSSQTEQASSQHNDTVNPPSFTPHSKQEQTFSQTHETPTSFTPRSSRGQNGRASSYAGQQSSVKQARPQSNTMPVGQQSFSSHRPAYTAAKKPHRLRNGIIAALLIVLLALGFMTLGVWNWVNNKLVKEDWLTSTATGSATTWLILGSDERDGTTGTDDTPGDRTDTILILTKPKHGPSSLISVPRDSLVEVDDALLKINAVMQIYGKQELVNQIEDITGQKVDHVAKITFGGLTGVVDALGGIELCYDQDVDDELSDLHWQAGCHVVDGYTALAFSRMRYSDPNGDFGRAERQRQVIGAIAQKGSSRSTLMNFGTVRNVAEAALSAITVDENTNPKTLLDMLLAFKSASSSDGITGSLYWSDPDYYVDGVGSSVLLDQAKNIELFKELAAGTHAPGQVGSAAELS